MLKVEQSGVHLKIQEQQENSTMQCFHTIIIVTFTNIYLLSVVEEDFRSFTGRVLQSQSSKLNKLDTVM